MAENETLILLFPWMKRQLDFSHPLMDDAKFYKLKREQVAEVLDRYVQSRDPDDAEILSLSHLWIVHEYVCRLRAYWSETREMTDDLVGTGLQALDEFVKQRLQAPITQQQFFQKLRSFVYSRLRDYINDNRSAFAASRDTNCRRFKEEKPLEYNFACELNEEIVGGEVDDPYLIDVLDAIEVLNSTDAEEMRDLVLKFLDQNHNISEQELSPEEQATLEKLTDLVRNAGL